MPAATPTACTAAVPYATAQNIAWKVIASPSTTGTSRRTCSTARAPMTTTPASGRTRHRAPAATMGPDQSVHQPIAPVPTVNTSSSSAPPPKAMRSTVPGFSMIQRNGSRSRARRDGAPGGCTPGVGVGSTVMLPSVRRASAPARQTPDGDGTDRKPRSQQGPGRVQQLGPVVADLPHRRIHLTDAERRVFQQMCVLEDPGLGVVAIVHGGVEPGVDRLAPQHHRGAVVDPGEIPVRLPGDDRGGQQEGAVLARGGALVVARSP